MTFDMDFETYFRYVWVFAWHDVGWIVEDELKHDAHIETIIRAAFHQGELPDSQSLFARLLAQEMRSDIMAV